jgi:hypothetical protein
MDIDPAGGDEQTVRLDLAFGCAGLAADRGQPATVDRDVAGKGLAASAIQDRSAANHGVMHGFRPALAYLGTAKRGNGSNDPTRRRAESFHGLRGKRGSHRLSRAKGSSLR